MTHRRLVSLPIIVTDESQAPRGADLYYRCKGCEGTISSQPPDSVGCACGNVFIDVGYHRLVIRDFKKFEVVQLVSDPPNTDAWTPFPPREPDIDVFHKQFGDGPDVIVAIRRDGDGFVVRTSAESRTSGPNVTMSERFATIEEARSKLLEECAGWDRDMEAELPPLSSLRLYDEEPPN